MNKYIDCDGVILNTEENLFDDYYELKKKNPELKRTQYLQGMDWDYWLRQATVLNDALEILKSYNPSSASILTKVHSLKEARAKIQYFREHKVKNNIIIVPDDVEKNSVVIAKDSILVDDSEKNLTEWENAGGIPIYYGKQDSMYQKITSLDEIFYKEKSRKKKNHY